MTPVGAFAIPIKQDSIPFTNDFPDFQPAHFLSLSYLKGLMTIQRKTRSEELPSGIYQIRCSVTDKVYVRRFQSGWLLLEV